ncbi:NAD(P)-dependent oxidoreductase, partial [Sulfolobus sp. A20-N-F6]
LTSLFLDASRALNRNIRFWFPLNLKLIEPFKNSHQVITMLYDVLSNQLVYSYEKAKRELNYEPDDVRVETFKEMAKYYNLL